MEALFTICCALSVGLVMGFCCGGIKMAVRSRSRFRRSYTSVQIERAVRLRKRAGAVLKFVTFLFLALGLVWCLYYLVLGAYDPSQAEYATSMSQLIVSVLTIVSIGFAFFEFLRSSTQAEGEARLQEVVAAAADCPEAEGVGAAGSAEAATPAAAAAAGAPEADDAQEAATLAAGMRTEGEARP